MPKTLIADLKSYASKAGGLHAISIRQPWAGAVAMFQKNVENRSSWKYRYRGPLLIHASSGPAHLGDLHEAAALARRAGVDEDLIQSETSDPQLVGFWGRGVILGLVILVDVIQADDPAAKKSPMWDSPWRDPKSRYWLHIENFVPFIPLPHKGRVGLFKVPAETVNDLRSLSEATEDDFR
jgi:hypothetical protein